MQPDGVVSRRASPVRNNAAAGANSRVTLQKHQQSLKSCLDLCNSLGFHCDEDASTSRSQTPLQACQLVDCATQLFTTQMEAASKEHANLFGRLLDPDIMEGTVRRSALQSAANGKCLIMHSLKQSYMRHLVGAISLKALLVLQAVL